MPHTFRFPQPLVLALLLGAAPALQGCVVAAVGAAGAGAGYTLSQERSPKDLVNDKAIEALVVKSWKDYNHDMAQDLDATVYEARVLVTGRVPSDQWREEAIKRAWQVDGVKEVYNEVEVGSDPGFWQDMRDGTISNRLRGSLIGDGYVKSVNYTVTTVQGIVYIIGSARSQAELDRVTNHARNIPDVRRVISYVRIRTGEPAQPEPATASSPAPVSSPVAGNAMPASASPAPPASISTPDNAPTPRQSIQVTPLQ